MKLLSFGEIIWDIFDKSAYIGGAPLNLAAHAAMQGSNACIVSCVGDDRLGREAISEIEKTGVKTDYVSVCNKPTGQCIVILDEHAVPSYNLIPDAAYDYITINPALFSEKFDILSFGTLSLRKRHNITTLKKLISQENYKEIFTDLNIRKPFYSGESILFCLQNATIVKISDEELPVVTDMIIGEKLLPEAAALAIAKKFSNLKIIIITKGENGSMAYDCTKKKFYSCNAVKTKVVSTVGAGDSFGATFLTQYFRTTDIDYSLNIASKVSGFVVSVKEAVPNYNINDF